MRSGFCRVLIVVLAVAVAGGVSSAGVERYVYPDSPSPAYPFTNWATAAHDIQSAIDAAADGDIVTVTNGIYDTGGAVAGSGITNRIAVTNRVTIRSVNGAEHTIIRGQGPTGDAAVRCAYLCDGASLEGFTLEGGHTADDWDRMYGYGGGVLCESTGASVSNCVIASNSAYRGGGSAYGTLYNCTLSGNSADYGGGSAYGTLNNCTLSGNSAEWSGGGSDGGTLYNCTLWGNSAEWSGGGSDGGTLYNCTLWGNSASSGGGSDGGTLNNCTLTGNSADNGGGSYEGTLNNCIIYGNRANAGSDNNDGGSLAYCCVTPYYSGTGNFTNAPLLIGLNNPHLLPSSPCIDAGNNGYAGGARDIDSEPRTNGAAVDVGCDEVWANSLTGALELGFACVPTNFVRGLTINYSSLIQGRATSYGWQMGDGTTFSNLVQFSYAYATTGQHDLVLWASNLNGYVAMTTTVSVIPDRDLYVALDGGHLPPYTNWSMAATNLQAAIDAAHDGDRIWVTNGVYDTGGAVAGSGITNRIAVTNRVTIRSINGAEHTIIRGQGPTGDAAVRCAYLCNGASLEGFTLEGGYTANDGDRMYGYGGGVLCESTGAIVSNCVIASNSAYKGGGSYEGTLYNCTLSGNSASDGGGSAYGTLNNCTLSGNSASDGGGSYYGTLYNCTLSGNSASSGGGSYYSTLNNCTLWGNSASSGGGSYYSTLNNCTLWGNSASSGGGGSRGGTLKNCIVYYNSAPDGMNYIYGTLRYSCTTPNPGGTGNITNAPMLLSASHLASNSPCIGAGDATYASGTDIDGEAWRAPPSMGCDEPYYPATGALAVAIIAAKTRMVPGYTVAFSSDVQGAPTGVSWTFGDGTVVSNQAFHVEHAWASPGVYEVVLRAWNDGNPGGVAATVQVQVVCETNYVDLSNTSPSPPYTSWATAGTNIQDAIDEAAWGGLILVSNGVYETGGRPAAGSSRTNRVTIDKDVTVRSVNGPSVTIIRGRCPIDNTVVRCVWMADGAVLSGFTLTDGVAVMDSGGGVWCQGREAEVVDCIISDNEALSGGGAVGGTLRSCVLSNNYAYNNGGARDCTLYDCVLVDNGSGATGGGASDCTLNNCKIINNRTWLYGGGARNCTLNNCTLSGNRADDGGGARDCTLNNCVLSDNQADNNGGGSHGGSLNNCTLSGNSAGIHGGGSYYGTLNNCIVYYNTAPFSRNYHSGSLSNCCTTPSPGGTGNITDEPILLSESHIAGHSPCVGAGNAGLAGGTDIDGESWRAPPSVGCDEPYSPVTGSLSVAITAVATNVAVHYSAGFSASIQGVPTGTLWRFGDGVEATNQFYDVQHAWSFTGLYDVVYQAWNDDNPGGVAVTVQVHVLSATNYVDSSSPNPSPPYASWMTAATTIQDALDVSAEYGATILVSNGLYNIGGRPAVGCSLTNRVTLDKPVTVRSVNGPSVTTIRGQGPIGDAAVRCVWMTNGAVLSGFTLTNGATHTRSGEEKGGGIWCQSTNAVVSNCVLSGNSARNGGGSCYGTLNNCMLLDNSAGYGGGSYYGTLNNCTLSGNTADLHGGGSRGGTLNNCIVYYNSAPDGMNYIYGTLRYCCTTPNPGGTGNITNAPMFVASNDYRLAAGSPCIDAGSNAFMPAGPDLDGSPRPLDGDHDGSAIVDMGAFEAYFPSGLIPPGWLAEYGLPTDGSADFDDDDDDGYSNYEEYIALTVPTSGVSYLAMDLPVSSPAFGGGLIVTWRSSTGRVYRLDRTLRLAELPFSPIASNIPGQAGTTSYTDATATNSGPYIYRVNVGMP